MAGDAHPPDSPVARAGHRVRPGAWLALLVLATGCTEPTDFGPLRLSAADRLELQIVPHSPPPRSDPAVIQSAAVDDDWLVLDVAYAGGCRTHRFGMVHDGTQGLSLPPFVPLYLVHDAGGDRCEALITRRIAVDLRPLQAGNPGGLLLLRLIEPDGSPVNLTDLRYQFAPHAQ